MAITTVTGQVGRTFYDGKGAEVIESWQQGGETMTKKWSAFFNEPHGLTEGDQVEVSGIHGDKIDEWDKDGEKRRADTVLMSDPRTVLQWSAELVVMHAIEENLSPRQISDAVLKLALGAEQHRVVETGPHLSLPIWYAKCSCTIPF